MDDGLARRCLRERDELIIRLHARPVRVRAHRDGAPRLRAAAHDGVRHGGAVGRRRQPVGDQAREGEGRARRDGARHDDATEGEFLFFGNHDNRVDTTSRGWVVSNTFMGKLEEIRTYRDALHTQTSILTITSNVVYGKATGNTPGTGVGRASIVRAGCEPHDGRDSYGLHVAAASVAETPYRDAADGISLTATLVPEASAASRRTVSRTLPRGCSTRTSGVIRGST